ncbi:glycosyltransferase [Buttiauxella gaviniae]|uniref:glycosyltransferase n=1 Tax=Buttiauxella gaviniae TaxID=82990 RepID=UPI0039AF9AAF
MDILLSTYGDRILKIYRLVDSIDFENFNLIICHQYIDEPTNETRRFINKLCLIPQVSYFSMANMGVTTSRNFLIRKSVGEYIVFCDDDIVYIKGALLKIIKAMRAECIDIATGITMISQNDKLKPYPEKKHKHNLKSIMRVGTVEIICRRESILESGLFPEDMGAGTKFPICDEPVFLANSIKKGANVVFIPEPISIHPALSSGFQTFPHFTMSRGLCFKRVFGWYGFFLIIPFAVRMYSKNKKINFYTFLRDMIRGFYAK